MSPTEVARYLAQICTPTELDDLIDLLEDQIQERMCIRKRELADALIEHT